MTEIREVTWPRIPQGDLDAELTLVNAVIKQPALAESVLAVVNSEDFTDLVCSRIWRVVERLTKSGRPIGFDEVVHELDPEEVLGPNGCPPGESVADCVRHTMEFAGGMAGEARLSAWRIRSRSLARSLFALLVRCGQALVANPSQEVRDLARDVSRLAIEYRKADVQVSRELGRIQREWKVTHRNRSDDPNTTAKP
jgi:replicative DNA helicase